MARRKTCDADMPLELRMRVAQGVGRRHVKRKARGDASDASKALLGFACALLGGRASGVHEELTKLAKRAITHTDTCLCGVVLSTSVKARVSEAPYMSDGDPKALIVRRPIVTLYSMYDWGWSDPSRVQASPMCGEVCISAPQ